MLDELPFFDAHTHADAHDTHAQIVENVNPYAVFSLDLSNPAAITTIETANYYSVGLHPWRLSEIVDMQAAFIALEAAAKLPNVLAIGEAGLDKYYEHKSDKILQINVLAQHIDLAIAVQKPLILHTVGRFNETLQLLKQAKQSLPNTILHGFNQNEQVAKMFWQIGVYTSFGADIFSRTNTNTNTNTKAADSLKACPSSLLLLESDAQSQYNIADIYEKAAELRGCTLGELKELISQNVARVLGYVCSYRSSKIF
jgi:TatD DNase family protein